MAATNGNRPAASIGKNISMERDGDMLTIRVDLSKTVGTSSSGKSIIIASSEGNQTIPGTDAKIGLNIYRSK